MEVGKENEESAEGIQQGKDEIMNLMLAFIESMALKCVVELQIPDIIHSHGSPLYLSQIATKIGSHSLNLSHLTRVMRLLVHRKVFSAATAASGETLYGLTRSSRLLLHGSNAMTMVPILMMNSDPRLVDPWHHLSASIKDDENVIKKAYGSSLMELRSTDPDLNSMFNSGLEGATKINVNIIMTSYKDGFLGIKTLVDVGGGTGYFLSEVVKANWPRITGINYELQHVVETAPSFLCPGITHVAGDMFESIPTADGLILKSVLHNWNDEDCKKVLRNCGRALSKAAGKLIVVEIVDEAKESFNETTVKMDLLMMAHYIGGKERTKLEWTNLLEDSGFSRITFIKIPSIYFIIEAYACSTTI